MKIVYPVPSELTSTGGHIQHVLGLCRHAAKFGVEIELYCVKAKNHPVKEDFKVVEFDIPKCGPQKRLLTFCRMFIEELSKNPRPDWVYFRPFPLDYALLSRYLIKAKIPYAYELNTLWADELRSQGKPIKALIYPWFEAKSIRHASILFPVTKEIEDLAKRSCRQNIRSLIAGNGIEIPSIPANSREEIRRRWKLPLDKILITMAGFTRPWHGYEKLLAAMPSLPIHTHVVLVGSENESVTDHVMKLANSLNVADRTHVLPWLPHKEVDEIVYACDVGVSPLALEVKKMKEAQSLKVRHYLAMGLPVLVAGGESKDVSESKFIYQILETTTLDIQKGLNHLIQLNAKRDDIRNFAKEKLSWEAIAGKTLRFIQEYK